MPDPRYREAVSAAWWLVTVIGCAGLAPRSAALTAWQHGQRLEVALLLGASALLVLVAIVFLHLRVEIDDATLRFRFGPFGRTLLAADIESAAVERYRWGTCGGWGWRFGWLEGSLVQAFSVPFLRTGVRIRTRGGKQYYVSSRAPERMSAAIMQLARQREGSA